MSIAIDRDVPIPDDANSPRVRATRQEMKERRETLLHIIEEMHPMTVRQVFYQASSVYFLAPKTESGYAKIQTTLANMRRAGELSYSWIADNTRWQRKPTTFSNVEAALRQAARYYRKDLWEEADCYVEIWLEKDALAGVINEITYKYDVPLMVSRGYASLSFLHSAAEQIASLGVPTYIYHLGDFDPSGVNAADKIEQTLCELAPDADINFTKLGVTPRQIEGLNLPTRPTKKSDPRAAKFGDHESVELDAMDPRTLRALVEEAIHKHLPPDRYEELRQAEAEDRRRIMRLVEDVIDEDEDE